jgi:hypothetical protein
VDLVPIDPDHWNALHRIIPAPEEDARGGLIRAGHAIEFSIFIRCAHARGAANHLSRLNH